MSEYFATVEWKRGSQLFSDKKYSRAHEWQFEGGRDCTSLVVSAYCSFAYVCGGKC